MIYKYVAAVTEHLREVVGHDTCITCFNAYIAAVTKHLREVVGHDIFAVPVVSGGHNGLVFVDISESILS